MSQATIASHYYNIEQHDSLRHYEGLPMICVEGLHELVEEIARTYLKPGQCVLDVGCGRGAFALRMADLGYWVDACDRLDHCMCKDQVNFFCIAAEQAKFERQYDAVFLLELIEHTEAPFAIMRQYAEVLKPGGYMIISTPNIESAISRSWFALSGRHWYFDDDNVKRDGHINPILDFQLAYIFAELGLRRIEQKAVYESRNLRMGAHWFLHRVLQTYEWLKGVQCNQGPCIVNVVQKPL